MSERPPVIDYARPRRRTRWWVLPFLREVINLALWGVAVVGAFQAADGVMTFSSMHPTGYAVALGHRIETPAARAAWVSLNVVMAIAAVGAARWHTKRWDAELAARKTDDAARHA